MAHSPRTQRCRTDHWLHTTDPASHPLLLVDNRRCATAWQNALPLPLTASPADSASRLGQLRDSGFIEPHRVEADGCAPSQWTIEGVVRVEEPGERVSGAGSARRQWRPTHCIKLYVDENFP